MNRAAGNRVSQMICGYQSVTDRHDFTESIYNFIAERTSLIQKEGS
ncbi:25645_t:CDS:2 [Gigaspora rosea]|nr:25645_t:CDS:2 [Gigaspora rosea]